MSVKYEVVGGDLPIGVDFKTDGKLKGRILFENIGLAPVWNTEGGLLGTFDEGQTVNLSPMSVTPVGGFPFERFGLVNVSNGKYSALPWGLTLNSYTGEISGTILELPTAEPVWFSGEEPLWETTEGNLGSFIERETVNISLSALPSKPDGSVTYHIVNKFLPWGLILNRDIGEITGIINDLKVKDIKDVEIIGTKPTWNTVKGLIGYVNEGDKANFVLSAKSAVDGNTVTYHIVHGFLPWGFTLDRKTGVITGTALELRQSGIPVESLGNDPVWSNNVTVNGVSKTIAAGGSLGQFKAGDTVNIQLGANAAPGRTLSHYYVHYNQGSGGLKILPLGLTFDRNTGTITGTISSEITVPTTYEFKLVAVDSAGVQTVRTYSITVSE